MVPDQHEGAGQRDGHQPCRQHPRGKLCTGEPSHLAEVAHGQLARIGLPVSVGDKAHRGIEGEVRGRKPRQPPAGLTGSRSWNREDQEQRHEAGDREGQHRERIGDPALFLFRIDAGNAVEQALHRPPARGEEIALAVEACAM